MSKKSLLPTQIEYANILVKVQPMLKETSLIKSSTRNGISQIIRRYKYYCQSMSKLTIHSAVSLLPTNGMTLVLCFVRQNHHSLHCTALHCTALHCTALHCTPLHCAALHCTALHCTALHCTVGNPSVRGGVTI